MGTGEIVYACIDLARQAVEFNIVWGNNDVALYVLTNDYSDDVVYTH